MKNETLKQVIAQIKKYKLIDAFKNIDIFKEWASTLNNVQIHNFLSLDIDLEEVVNYRNILIDGDLLKCRDYKEKVKAISKMKNGDGCWHLFDNICTPNFLNSKNFYKDIEMLSKADTARYGLWVIGLDRFINSPYHDEDLRLIVETHDTKKKDPKDFIVSDALATVAANIDSLNSPYHREDMDLIAASGSDCLQMSSSYPQHSLNALAINRMSLADKYHLENMQILAKKPLAEYFLYDIMTNPDIINRPTYREEVKILVNAQSKAKARALYYYIANPNEKFSSDDEYMNDVEYYNDMEYEKTRPLIYSNDYVDGTKDPDYLTNLNIINNMDDRLVMHFVSLLMTPAFINSPNKRFDIELLQRIKNPKIFWNLYLLMTEESILDKPYHKKDVVMISETINDKNRHLLLEKAAVHHEDNINHDYDMEYITKLDLESINDEIYKKIRHFLLSYAGINDPNHKEKLEQLAKGIMVRQDGSLSAYLDNLEKELETSIKTIIKSTPATMAKPKSYLLNLFKKR